MIEARFDLVDHHGRRVTADDYRGRFMLVFFGFTHCRVICPRALARLTEVLQQLGDRAARVAALYVSVDPERDTPEVMKAFLAGRAPAFVGLTGSRAQVDAARSGFRVFAERAVDPDDPAGYAVSHSAMTYLIDPHGNYMTHFPDAVGTEALSARLKEILGSAAG